MRINLEPCTITYKIYVGDQMVSQQTIEAPLMIQYSQFMNLVQQLANESNPMMLQAIQPCVIWDEFEWKQKTLENGITFKNKAMVAYHDNQ